MKGLGDEKETETRDKVGHGGGVAPRPEGEHLHGDHSGQSTQTKVEGHSEADEQ